MSGIEAESQSVSSSQSVPDAEGLNKAPTICEAFSNPAGNVFFKSSDNFRDFYLKANRHVFQSIAFAASAYICRCTPLIHSGLFRDVLCNTIASTSLQSPLPVDEEAYDLEIMLSIIVGKPEDVIHRARDWNQSARLNRLVNKYQFEGHRLWFSQMFREHAAEEPREALFLACSQSPVDALTEGQAISEGFSVTGKEKHCDPRYFEKTTGANKDQVLDASNASIVLGLKLGHTGSIAYTHTFSGSAPSRTTTEWVMMAQRFVQNVKAIVKANRSW